MMEEAYPVEKAAPSSEGIVTNTTAGAMRELGSTGLRKSGGIIHEEFLNRLHGQRGIRTYTEMRENDPVCNGILFAIEMLYRRLHVEIVPGVDGSDEATFLKEFVEDNIDGLDFSFEETMAEITSMFQFGWQLSEIVYKPGDDGSVRWSKFAPRGQETLWQWEFDNTGVLTGFKQLDMLGGVPSTPVTIPAEKFLLFRTTSYKNNPEGRSVLRGAYRPWYYKKRIEEIEAVGVERDLAGMPIIYAPEEYFSKDAPPEVRALFSDLLKTVQNIRRDEQDGMVFPLSYDREGNKRFEFELASTGGRRQMDTGGIVERYSRHMAMTVLADFILLGHEQVGSFALSSSKVDLFATAIDAWSDTIAAVFNRQAIPRLMRLNGYDDHTLYPKISFEPVRVPSLNELSQYITAMSSANAPLFPDDKLANHLRQRAGMPAADPEVLAQAQAQTEEQEPEPATFEPQEEDEEDED